MRICDDPCALILYPKRYGNKSPPVIDFVLCPVASLHRVLTHRSVTKLTESSSLIQNTSNARGNWN